MEYECIIVPFHNMTVTTGGVVSPLCNDCLAPDCTNPIKENTVSVFGVPHKMRLWVVNNMVRQVVNCKGYVGEKNVASRLPQEIQGREIIISHKADIKDSSVTDNGKKVPE